MVGVLRELGVRGGLGVLEVRCGRGVRWGVRVLGVGGGQEKVVVSPRGEPDPSGDAAHGIEDAFWREHPYFVEVRMIEGFAGARSETSHHDFEGEEVDDRLDRRKGYWTGTVIFE